MKNVLRTIRIQGLFLFLITWAWANQAQTLSFNWANRTGSTGNEHSNSSCLDKAGNIYTTGYFEYTVDFDPGPATYNLTATNWDIFVSKYDPSGKFIWAKKMGGSLADEGRSICADTFGNIYITGRFADSADLDPGPGVFPLFNTFDMFDAFVLKLDTAGNFIWAKQFRQTTYNFYNEIIPYSIRCGDDGSVYTCGHFGETYDFDPGPDSVRYSAGRYDIYVVKLDASGNLAWAKSSGGAFYDIPYDLDLDVWGNVYTTGYFQDVVDFDPGPGVYSLTTGSPSASNAFITKWDNAGNFIWAKQFQSSGSTMGYSVVTDRTGHVYCSGLVNGTADFDPGGGVFNLASFPGSYDGFLSKLDSSGTFNWADIIIRSYQASTNTPNALALDTAANIYATGYFKGTADFDPGADSFKLTSTNNAVFLSRIDSSGKMIWATKMGGSSDAYGNDVHLDAANNIYLSGYFKGTVDFNPGAGTNNLASAGLDDIFLVKLGQSTATGIRQHDLMDQVKLYPNPSTGLFRLDLGSSYDQVRVTVYDQSGRSVFSNLYSQSQWIELNVAQAAGAYLLVVTADEQAGAWKILKH